MGKIWVENKATGPRVIGGELLQPGEGAFVEDGGVPDPIRPRTSMQVLVSPAQLAALPFQGEGVDVYCSGIAHFWTGTGYRPVATQQDIAAQLLFADACISYIANGLALPSVGTNAQAAVSAGAVYNNGMRLTYPGGVPGFSNGDNYCDLNDQGALIVTTVAQAAASPAIPVNCIRLGYVRCAAGSVTASFTGVKDSLGNWMGNRVPKPACILHAVPNAAFSSGTLPYAFSAAANATQELDNAGMHSIVTNNTRITAQKTGLYDVDGCLQWSSGTIQELRLFKNGVVVKGVPEAFFGANTTSLSAAFAGRVFMMAGDYIEMMVTAPAAPYVYNATFSAALR